MSPSYPPGLGPYEVPWYPFHVAYSWKSKPTTSIIDSMSFPNDTRIALHNSGTPWSPSARYFGIVAHHHCFSLFSGSKSLRSSNIHHGSVPLDWLPHPAARVAVFCCGNSPISLSLKSSHQGGTYIWVLSTSDSAPMLAMLQYVLRGTHILLTCLPTWHTLAHSIMQWFAQVVTHILHQWHAITAVTCLD
jgi:hypothetical protein